MTVFIDDLILQPASNLIYIRIAPINTHDIAPYWVYQGVWQNIWRQKCNS